MSSEVSHLQPPITVASRGRTQPTVNAGHFIHSYWDYQGAITYEEGTVRSWHILTALAFNLGSFFLGIHQKTVDSSTVNPLFASS